jgi:hypothetical protein
MFRCAEDRQAVRSGDRHASLSRGDFRYSVVRLETDHSAVPICQHADTLSQIERKPNAALTANTVSRVLGRPASGQSFIGAAGGLPLAATLGPSPGVAACDSGSPAAPSSLAFGLALPAMCGPDQSAGRGTSPNRNAGQRAASRAIAASGASPAVKNP